MQNESLLYEIPNLLICAFLFALILFMYHSGSHLRQKMNRQSGNPETQGMGAIEGSLLGLLALLLSFTFGMSASHYDQRRSAIVQEANDVGTALLRCDLYNKEDREVLRMEFHRYIQQRIAFYDAGTDLIQKEKAASRARAYSGNIWKIVTYLSRNPENTFGSQQMVPAVNAMIDSEATREEALSRTVPDSIIWLLLVLILTGSAVVGYGNPQPKMNLPLVGGFALMTTLTVFLILDLDRPRRGFITTDDAEAKMEQLLSSFEVTSPS